jgi:hypothetical protein
MQKPPIASVVSFVSELRALASSPAVVSDELREPLLESARLLEIFSVSEAPANLPGPDEEELFLSRLEVMLPNHLTGRQIPMLLSFILDRYGLPIPAVMEAMQVTLAFLHNRPASGGETRH